MSLKQMPPCTSPGWKTKIMFRPLMHSKRNLQINTDKLTNFIGVVDVLLFC